MARPSLPNARLLSLQEQRRYKVLGDFSSNRILGIPPTKIWNIYIYSIYIYSIILCIWYIYICIWNIYIYGIYVYIYTYTWISGIFEYLDYDQLWPWNADFESTAIGFVHQVWIVASRHCPKFVAWRTTVLWRFSPTYGGFWTHNSWTRPRFVPHMSFFLFQPQLFLIFLRVLPFVLNSWRAKKAVLGRRR